MSQPTSEARFTSYITITESNAINSDLERVSNWDSASMTCLILISLSNFPSDYSISFRNVKIVPLISVNILGLEISTNLSLRNHIEGMAKSASK